MKKKWLLGILSGLCALTCIVGFSSCGHTHTYTDEVTNPTCTEQGYTTHTCSCGETYKDTYVNALGHDFVGEECVACGKTFSQGLAYELSEDATYYTVTGIGTCTDIELIMPTIYNNLPVTGIGSFAFAYCKSLTSIVIPDSVTSIGDSAFAHCDSLTSVVIPNGVTSIDEYVFYYCTSLTSIVIPDSVTSIGELAFFGCSSLTSVTFGDGVTSIGSSAFSDCSSLTSITVDEGNEYYCDIDGNLYSKDGKELIQYAIGKKATSFTIPDCVTSIGYYAFQNCTNLTSVVIPNGVTSIGGYAFYGCYSLTSIVIPDSVTRIASYEFYGCPNLTIYCEAESKPSGWPSDWNYFNCPVVWGYKGE